MEEASKYILFHAHGSGSVFPHAVLRLLELPHEIVDCNYDEVTQKRGSDYDRLVKANPLAQFPTLVTPEGNVMTEMVAIVLYLQNRHASDTSWGINKLSPSQLAAFYRWFIFIPANVYPVLTMGEFPGRFVRVPADAGISPGIVEGWITQGVYARREELWRMLEAEMTREMGGGRFLLGTEQPTLLDVFVAMMAHFMPHIGRGTEWFIKNCPRLYECVQATLEIRIVRETFGESGLNEYSNHGRDAMGNANT
ncbi:hypothetical protein BDV93DRAFT_521266 [Ceratobasidium sp. AG-I]|nr:hypothetical protein BDV93DRAFT_521266 [Ceratobasidium sp. AG-I]